MHKILHPGAIVSLEGKYNPREQEKKWQDFWQEKGVFAFDPDSKKPIYSIDTPPPTVSGALHIGHVYSYTQAEIIARYQRMSGKNVFYPFGFDDNGLPTEKFVEKERGIRGHEMGRSEFNQICKETVAETEARFKALWISLGFSADWGLTYSSIDEKCQRISQRSFLDLYKKGIVYYKEEPHMWCCDARTAIAQAELEATEKESFFHDVRFDAADGSGASIVIGTTRPELMSACACIFVHPEDERYTHLVGKTMKVPLFGHSIPILTDEKADKEKGTGAVMCCTFGDKTDVEWYKKHNLPLKMAITREGKMSELAQEFSGLKIREAREAIVKKLGDTGHLLASKPIVHTVNVYERSGKEVEFLVTPQWFINVIDYKAELLRLGDELNWYPAFMKQRFTHWVENLNWDWCISRQRFFGVPFPVWHCEDCKGIVVASAESLPVDPLNTKPDNCPHCQGKNLTGDRNVMDTWATSSVTPQINAQWGETKERPNFMPMGMRPQAHDIIRTWAFYTMVKAYHHHGTLPWKDIMISGHVLYKKGQKISKSKGNSKSGPEELIETYSADVIRYWTAGARLGTDCYFEEQEFKIASRLVTKLYNASRFCAMHLKDFKSPDSQNITFDLDKGLIFKLNSCIQKADEYLSKYEYSLALSEIESFFWDFCDNYLELSKHRLYNPEIHNDKLGLSAKTTLYLSLNAIIKLLAPFVPHITEEIYQSLFSEQEKIISLHLSDYPKPILGFESKDSAQVYEESCRFVAVVRRFKTENRISLNSPLESISYLLKDFPHLKQAKSDIVYTAHCQNLYADEGLRETGTLICMDGVEMKIEMAKEIQAESV